MINNISEAVRMLESIDDTDLHVLHKSALKGAIELLSEEESKLVHSDICRCTKCD